MALTVSQHKSMQYIFCELLCPNTTEIQNQPVENAGFNGNEAELATLNTTEIQSEEFKFPFINI